MRDLLLLALRAIGGHRLRSTLSIFGIAIGVASVILLTSVGEGTRRYIMDMFTQFGTNLIAVNPGKSETVGLPGALGGSTQKLTLDDAEALARLPGIEAMAPIAFGMARVEAGERGRSVFVYGTTPQIQRVLRWRIGAGSFWPEGDPRRGPPLAVLGPKLKRELFGSVSPLGDFVKIGGTRFRVSGVMQPKGQMLGFDLDDAAFVPVARALKIFNLSELVEIDLLFEQGRRLEPIVASVKRTLIERHRGREDFTVTTQAEMLDVFGNVMDIVTLAVGGIGGVSLLVGAIGILTMMWIAVGERTNEIGLVRSLGATRRQVELLFLAESAALATLGGLVGAAVGLGICALLRAAVPGLPVETPLPYLAAALAVSIVTGIGSGVLPARRAADLDPVEALRTE